MYVILEIAHQYFCSPALLVIDRGKISGLDITENINDLRSKIITIEAEQMLASDEKFQEKYTARQIEDKLMAK